MPAKTRVGPKCAVCQHGERTRIEALHVSGLSLEKLAARFDLNKDAIFRHCKNHMTDAARARYLVGPARIAELAEIAAEENRSLVDYLGVLRSALFGQLDRLASADNHYGVSIVAGRLMEVLRELGRLTGEITNLAGSTFVTVNNSHVTFLNSPPFADLQSGLLKVCAAHPDARADILALFRDLDQKYTDAPAAKPNMRVIEHAA